MAPPKDNFSYSTRRLGRGLVWVEVRGYLDAKAGEVYLRELRRQIEESHENDQQSVGLLFKDALTGFDPGTAAKMHGQFFREMGDRVHAIAIVSTRLSMRFGVAGAKLIAKQPIDIFSDEKAANAWLARQHASSKSSTG